MAERTEQQSIAKELSPARLRVIIHPAEEGGYWAEVPGFPGCVSEGETREEVRANIREAFLGVLGAMQDEAEPGPDQTPQDIIEEIEL